MISVIIPTTNGGVGYLAGLMPQLSQEENKEVIVVDNASKDGSANYLSQYDCTIICNRIGKNFSESNNQGAKIAQGDYLLFLNNDTQVSPGFLDEMQRTFNEDPKCAVVGCLMYTQNLPRKIQHAGINFTDEYVPYELGPELPGISPVINKNDPIVTSVREVPSTTAACAMVKTSIFKEVGGFDEAYRHGWEDTDLFLKMREKGYTIWYTGRTSIIHKKFGSAHAGRFKFENANRQRYDEIWVNTGRAKAVLGDFKRDYGKQES